MLGKVVNIDHKLKEVIFTGYIKNNFLNVKRLIHITGISA